MAVHVSAAYKRLVMTHVDTSWRLVSRLIPLSTSSEATARMLLTWSFTSFSFTFRCGISDSSLDMVSPKYVYVQHCSSLLFPGSHSLSTVSPVVIIFHLLVPNLA